MPSINNLSPEHLYLISYIENEQILCCWNIFFISRSTEPPFPNYNLLYSVF